MLLVKLQGGASGGGRGGYYKGVRAKAEAGEGLTDG